MKSKILFICFIANIIFIPYCLFPFLTLPIDVDFYKRVIEVMAKGFLGLGITYFLGILSLILWVNNLIFWNKNDKDLKTLLGLFFLTIFYSPFYYYSKIRKLNT